jgi:RHS repeat-associated protein
MKRFILLFQCLILSLIASAPLAHAQYQTGCGNDSQENHGCNKTGCQSDDSSNDNSDTNDLDDGDGDDSDDCDDAGSNPINPEKANHHRNVPDISTFGPAPITFARNVNSRTTDFNDPYWELGYKQIWQHNWNYEVRQLSTKTYGFFDIKVRYPDGNDYNFKATDATGAQLAPSADNGDRLYRWSGSKVGYTMVRPNGSEYDFWRYLSPKFHLTQVRNGLGYYWNCTYDSNQQLNKITNNFGRWIQIDHQTGPDGVLRINQVSSSDGRTVIYGYSPWASSGKYVLTSVNYPGGEQATYTYVTSDPNNAAARPLLSSATDPTYRHGKPGAQMKYTYNYAALSFGNMITGTLLEERSNVTDQSIISFPQGSGSYPQILEGDGTEITRRYTNGLLSTKGDGEGRMTSYARDTGGFGFVATKTAADGAVTQYTRDYAGRILTKTDALGQIRSHSFNPKGFILSKTDELGRTISWARDSSNRRTRKDYPDGNYETWTYNANSQPLTHRLRNGGTESFTYDSFGNKTSQTDAVGNVTSYTYYPNGLVSSVTDARLNTTSYTYNWRGQQLTITHPDNSTISYQYDTLGNRTAVTDELGHTTTYTYDEYNRVKTVTDPLGRTTTYEYGRAPGCNACSYANTITRIISPSGTETTFSYDQSGLRTCQTVGAGTADAATTTYAYDDAKNVTTVIDPRGKVWHYGYDSKRHKISAVDPLGNMTLWSYDGHGNKLSETRPDGGVTSYVYDARNRLTEATDPAGHITQMTYDNADNLLTLIDARNNVYTLGYDALNRKTSLTYPDNSVEDYTYDPVGNVATYTARARQVKTSTYDSRNRETGFSWSDSTPAVAKTYDVAGRLLTLNSSVSALSYTYDDANQLISETQQILPDQAPMSFSYTYDQDGRRFIMREPSSQGVTYEYGARGQLTKVLNGIRTFGEFAYYPPILASYTYDLNGSRLSRTLVDQGEQHPNANYAYDDANRLLGLDNVEGINSFARFDYTYNAVGNRTSRQSTVNGQPSLDTYAYDAIDQVAQAKYNFDASANAQDRQVDYGYDSAGNRASVTDNGSSTSYSANNVNEYTTTGSLTPAYDGNGNLIGYGASAYSYDAQNRLRFASSGSSSMNAAYDARNRCVSRTINGVTTYFYYDGWNLVEERDSAGNQIARYVYGTRTDELLRRSTNEGDVYYHQDALGSTIALTNNIGVVIERYSYDVFGAPTFRDGNGNALSSSAHFNRFLFTGREYLRELGLYDYRNRFYSPDLGRFLQTDPKRFNAGDINLYRYVANAPTRFIDPDGLDADTDSQCLDKCIQFCGGNETCVCDCFEKCSNGELPNILGPLSDPVPFPAVPATPPTLWETIVNAIWGWLTG